MTFRRAVWRDIFSLGGWVLVSYPAWLAASEWLGASTPRITAWGQTFLHWFIIPVGLFAIVAARLRLRPLAIVAALTTLSLTGTTFLAVRPFPVVTPKSGQPQLSIAFANVYNNNRVPADAARTLLATKADVIAIAELTKPIVKALTEQGIDKDYPHQAGSPAVDAGGIALWSRFPILGWERRQAGHPAILVTLDVDGTKLQLFVVHPRNNGIGAPGSEWANNAAEVASQSDALVGPVIVVGDFNATLAHPPLQKMQDNGFREVHSWLGHGLSPSWPTDRRFPPLFRIDHAFVRGAVAPLAVSEVSVPGSDHRGFTARYVLTG